MREDLRRPDRLYYAYTRTRLGLEVHYLFPNLGGAQRTLLVNLLEARNSFEVGLRFARKRRGQGPNVRRHGRLVGGWEARFRDLRARSRSLVKLPQLTAAQKKMLLTEFLALPGSQ
jgi:hypothetical protein